MLKELNGLTYLDYPISDILDPTAEVYFILDADPFPLRGRCWPAVLPIPRISSDSTEGTLTPYFNIGVDYEKLRPACTFHSQGIYQL